MLATKPASTLACAAAAALAAHFAASPASAIVTFDADYLVTDPYPTGVVNGLCSGFLLNEKYVVSAAHCKLFGGDDQFIFGPDDMVYTSVRTVVHPDWDYDQLGTDGANDIMIFELDRPVAGTVSYDVFGGTLEAGNIVTLASVGSNGGGNGFDLPPIEFGTPNAALATVERVGSTHFDLYVGDDDTPQSVFIGGDSGGAALVDVGGEMQLAGVISGIGIGDDGFVEPFMTIVDPAFVASVVPEPGSLSLLAAGALLATRRRR